MSGRRNVSRVSPAPPNKRDLAAFLFLRRRLRAAQDGLGGGEQPRAVGLQRVERAGADQVLQLHAVELARIDARGEVARDRRTVASPRASTSDCIAAKPTFFTAASA